MEVVDVIDVFDDGEDSFFVDGVDGMEAVDVLEVIDVEEVVCIIDIVDVDSNLFGTGFEISIEKFNKSIVEDFVVVIDEIEVVDAIVVEVTEKEEDVVVFTDIDEVDFDLKVVDVSDLVVVVDVVDIIDDATVVVEDINDEEFVVIGFLE